MTYEVDCLVSSTSKAKSHPEAHMNGRATFIMLLATGALIVGSLFACYGYEKTWRLWNVRAMLPHFADTRFLTATADSLAEGHDPYLHNPQDPWGRKFNYPRIWLGLLSSGITQNHTTAAGLTIICLFFLSVLCSFDPYGHGTACVLFAVLVSPAVALAIERANVDLLLFAILAGAIATGSSTVSCLSIVGCSFLKLYPIAGLAYVLREDRRRFWFLSAVSFFVFTVYVAFTFVDLNYILRSTPKGIGMSYGVHVFWFWLRLQLGIPLGSHLGRFAMLASYAFAFLIFAAAALTVIRHPRVVPPHRGKSMDCFRTGASVYIGTFLLGTNFDYKLVFLVLTVPQLVSWLRNSTPYASVASKVALLAIIVSSWSLVLLAPLEHLPAGPSFALVLDELANWSLFAGLVYLILYSVPDWLADDARRAPPARFLATVGPSQSKRAR